MTPKLLFIGFAVSIAALHITFFRRLQKHCPEEWRRLGSPSPFFAKDIRTGWTMTRYILMGGFERLQDIQLVRLGRVLRCAEWLYILGFPGFAILFLDLFIH
jgi:hypothetical protein